MKHIGYYVAVVLFVAAGCSGPAHEYDAIVTGTVTVDGELAKSGTVTFHPAKAGQGKVTIGRIHANGSYSLRTGQGDLSDVDGGTVMPGDYIVTVSITGPPVAARQGVEGEPQTAGPSLVAAKYSDKESSDLKRTVVAGSQVINLELEAAEAAPPTDEPTATAEGEPTADVPGATLPTESVPEAAAQ